MIEACCYWHAGWLLLLMPSSNLTGTSHSLLKSSGVPCLETQSNPEMDALGQRQRRSVVHGVRLPSHVLLPGIGTGLSTAARVLLSTKGAANLRPRRPKIHVSDAAVRASRRK